MDPHDRRRGLVDEILVRRVLLGDDAAMVRLYQRYGASVRYYLRRLVSAQDVADDLSQNVWLKVLRGMKKLRRPASFRPWLYRIARNEALRQLGRKGRRVSLEDVEDPPAPEDTPDDDAQLDAALVHVALEKLAPHHREVLTLKFIEGMSYEEIASVIDRPLGTVRSRIHAARRKMRAVLERMRDEREKRNGR